MTFTLLDQMLARARSAAATLSCELLPALKFNKVLKGTRCKSGYSELKNLGKLGILYINVQQARVKMYWVVLDLHMNVQQVA